MRVARLCFLLWIFVVVTIVRHCCCKRSKPTYFESLFVVGAKHSQDAIYILTWKKHAHADDDDDDEDDDGNMEAAIALYLLCV